MKILGALLCILFFVSCVTSFRTRHNGVYKLHEYGNSKSLSHVNKPFYFRYSIANEEINIWSNDSLHYFGEIFCYTARLDKQKRRYYGMNFQIPDSVTNKIIRKFNSLGVRKTLVEDSCSRFTTCDDCGPKEYEYSSSGHYIHRMNFSDKGYQTMDSFGNYIEQYVEANKKFNLFIDCLPHGEYQKNMVILIK